MSFTAKDVKRLEKDISKAIKKDNILDANEAASLFWNILLVLRGGRCAYEAPFFPGKQLIKVADTYLDVQEDTDWFSASGEGVLFVHPDCAKDLQAAYKTEDIQSLGRLFGYIEPLSPGWTQRSYHLILWNLHRPKRKSVGLFTEAVTEATTEKQLERRGTQLTRLLNVKGARVEYEVVKKKRVGGGVAAALIEKAAARLGKDADDKQKRTGLIPFLPAATPEVMSTWQQITTTGLQNCGMFRTKTVPSRIVK